VHQRTYARIFIATACLTAKQAITQMSKKRREKEIEGIAQLNTI